MTNQFTDEQVEAAVNAAWDEAMKHRGTGGQVVQAPTFEFIQVVHAALEAAAGVAPQAESERTPEFESREQELFKHQPVLSMKDGGIAGCKCIDRVFYNQTEDWGTHLAEVFDALAAPVQPSSTVDEDALAEVIRRSYENEQGLKIRDDKRTARAVAEWLRGESR